VPDGRLTAWKGIVRGAGGVRVTSRTNRPICGRYDCRILSPLFDLTEATGDLTGPAGDPRLPGSPEEGSWKVCMHLLPTLGGLLAAGRMILAVTGEGTWTQIDLDVVLDGGPPADSLAGILVPGVETWTNTDSHYPLDTGVVCRACRQTVSWPTPRPGEERV